MLGGRRIFATHYPHYGLGLACTGDYDVVCCGHSHAASVVLQPNVRGGGTWLVNPGTVAGLGAPATWILGDLADAAFRHPQQCVTYPFGDYPFGESSSTVIWCLIRLGAEFVRFGRTKRHPPGCRHPEPRRAHDGSHRNQPDHSRGRRRHQRHDRRARGRRVRQAGGLVESNPTLGGRTALLYRYFPEAVPPDLRARDQPAPAQGQPQRARADDGRGDRA